AAAAAVSTTVPPASKATSTARCRVRLYRNTACPAAAIRAAMAAPIRPVPTIATDVINTTRPSAPCPASTPDHPLAPPHEALSQAWSTPSAVNHQVHPADRPVLQQEHGGVHHVGHGGEATGQRTGAEVFQHLCRLLGPERAVAHDAGVDRV